MLNIAPAAPTGGTPGSGVQWINPEQSGNNSPTGAIMDIDSTNTGVSGTLGCTNIAFPAHQLSGKALKSLLVTFTTQLSGDFNAAVTIGLFWRINLGNGQTSSWFLTDVSGAPPGSGPFNISQGWTPPANTPPSQLASAYIEMYVDIASTSSSAGDCIVDVWLMRVSGTYTARPWLTSRSGIVTNYY